MKYCHHKSLKLLLGGGSSCGRRLRSQRTIFGKVPHVPTIIAHYRAWMLKLASLWRVWGSWLLLLLHRSLGVAISQWIGLERGCLWLSISISIGVITSTTSTSSSSSSFIRAIGAVSLLLSFFLLFGELHRFLIVWIVVFPYSKTFCN